ncbi:hypothetical protein [Dietzia sp. PP-33]|uniref:hypothetical protein n=1 Tax=Dietzia sp. PP-33 TaxID=2957500 RepID=UPI0029BE4BDA|nr:hypothetical protein [Dietzia sp. PP-33]MDX2358449.1 hypothetical protein [Dietzia sp. PP-33]
MRINEQIVVGAHGLGVEIARASAREGARVVVNYRRSEAAAGSPPTRVGRGPGAGSAVGFRE